MAKINFKKVHYLWVTWALILIAISAVAKAEKYPLSTAIDKLTSITVSGDTTSISYNIGNITSYNYTVSPDYVTCETSAYIIAKIGGVLYPSSGMKLTIPPKALSQNTVISSRFEWYPNYIDFVFQPSPMTFAKPLQLFISWYELNKMGLFYNPILYYDDGLGTPVRYTIDNFGVTYYLEHFSIYYFVRR